MIDFLLFFTKFTQVVPLKSKNVPDVIQSMQDCLKLMRNMPNLRNTDKQMQHAKTHHRVSIALLGSLIVESSK